jgi:integrase
LNQKTETQKENWISWDDVKTKFDELKKLNKFPKTIGENCYNNLLETVILGLYVLTAPRRNKDYIHMKFSKDGKNLDDKFNWLDLKKKQFVFNNYKTKKSYGQQILSVHDELLSLLKKFIKYNRNADNFLLAKFNGDRLASDNSITRKLNKIFNKNISSSMLRHIYLSDKYKDVKEAMKDDAEAMAHSTSQQKDYIKK